MAAPETPAPDTAETVNGRGNVEQLGQPLDKTSKQNKTLKQGRSWREVVKIHPEADKLPLLGKGELRALADDIKANGLMHRVQTFFDLKTNAEVLWDGRNRLDAIELNGRSTVTAVGKLKEDLRQCGPTSIGNDPAAYVISANLHRRHLSAEQKRDLIARLLKADPSKSNSSVADTAKVDDKTVAAVRDKLESTSEIPKLDKTTGRDGKSRPAKKPRKPAKAALPQPSKAQARMAAVAILDSIATTPHKDPETRERAEQGDYEAAIAAYSILTPAMKSKFWDYVSAGDAITIAEAAAARLADPTRREFADRILRTPPDMEAAS